MAAEDRQAQPGGSGCKGQSDPDQDPARAEEIGDEAPALGEEAKEKKATTGQQVLRYSILAGTPVVLTILGMQMWDWGNNHHFKAGSDGWFEMTNPSGGTDKIAHIYACYATTRLMRGIFRYTEGSEGMARFYSLLMGTVVGVGIEVGDGFSQSYGFSFTDLIADLVGIGLGALLDEFPELDAAIGLTGWWIPSAGFIDGMPGSWTDAFIDYTGQTYFLSVKFSGIPWARDTPLRYFQIDGGFYTRGFKKYDKMDEKQALFAGPAIPTCLEQRLRPQIALEGPGAVC